MNLTTASRTDASEPDPLSLEYKSIFGTEDGFKVWESTDGTHIQFTDPLGEVVASIRRPLKRPCNSQDTVA